MRADQKSVQPGRSRGWLVRRIDRRRFDSLHGWRATMSRTPPGCVAIRRARSSSIRQELARVGDLAGDRAGRNRGGRGQKNLALFVTHAAWKITIGRADAFHWRIHAPERIDRTAKAGGAAGIFGHLHSRIDEDLPHGFFAPASTLQI